MNRVRFGLESLGQLDMGKIIAAFDAERARVVQDCLDRPGDKKARAVTLEFLFAPVPNQLGTCEEVMMECKVTSKVPKRQTKIYTMSPNSKGDLAFHPDLPDEPDGSTLYDPDTGEVKD